MLLVDTEKSDVRYFNILSVDVVQYDLRVSDELLKHMKW
jgi:hypothetical protein